MPDSIRGWRTRLFAFSVHVLPLSALEDVVRFELVAGGALPHVARRVGWVGTAPSAGGGMFEADGMPFGPMVRLTRLQALEFAAQGSVEERQYMFLVPLCAHLRLGRSLFSRLLEFA